MFTFYYFQQLEKPLTNLVSHFHVIDSEHVPANEVESYSEVSTRIEKLCETRNDSFNLQSDRLNHNKRLANQMRRLEDDIIVTLNEKLARAASGLTVENATQRLADLQVIRSADFN